MILQKCQLLLCIAYLLLLNVEEAICSNQRSYITSYEHANTRMHEYTEEYATAHASARTTMELEAAKAQRRVRRSSSSSRSSSSGEAHLRSTGSSSSSDNGGTGDIIRLHIPEGEDGEDAASLEDHNNDDANYETRSLVYNRNTNALYDIYHASSVSPLASQLSYHAGETMRKLVGSNCVEIERGTVTKYYMCVGCVIENAMGCVNDMRQNKSGNVALGCKFDGVGEGNLENVMEQEQARLCCPKVFDTTKTLKYSHSAYPEAIRCIINAGCQESTIYTQLGKCVCVCVFFVGGGG